MSFLGIGSSEHRSSSHRRSKSPARSIVSTRSGEGAWVRPAASRTRSEPEGVFVKRRSSRSRSRSRDRGIMSSVFGGDDRRHSSHRSRSPGLGSFLGVAGGGSHSHSQSRDRQSGMFGGLFGSSQSRTRSPDGAFRSIFGGGSKHYSSTSRYNRRSRDGFLQKIMTAIRKLWRSLRRYAKNNPVKMVTLVIMPLLTSGILVKVLSGMGIRLPDGLAKLAGGKSQEPQRMSGGYYGSQGYGGAPAGPQQEGGIGLKEVMTVAKMFM